MLRHAPIVLSFMLALSGCAAAGAPRSSPHRDANLITADELATSGEGDLYNAIKRLRPAFMEARGPSSAGLASAAELIQVYVDGTRAGTLDALSRIRPGDVQEVRKLSSTDATQRFGINHTMGAILVKRK